ncbi:MAG TPA: thioredoxin family protein [Ktedonobacterales bacterium]
MTISRELFESGMTIDEFKAQMRENRDKLERSEVEAVIPPEERAFYAGLPEPLNVLVLAEDWCPDVVAGLSLVSKLAQETGKLNVRVLLRDQHLDVADQYLKEGKYRSIPVLVFFDQQMRQIGYIIERPARATAEMRAARDRYIAEHPENPELSAPTDQQSEETRAALVQVSRDTRAERSAIWTRYLLEDIHAQLQSVAAQA